MDTGPWSPLNGILESFFRAPSPSSSNSASSLLSPPTPLLGSVRPASQLTLKNEVERAKAQFGCLLMMLVVKNVSLFESCSRQDGPSTTDGSLASFGAQLLEIYVNVPVG